MAQHANECAYWTRIYRPGVVDTDAEDYSAMMEEREMERDRERGPGTQSLILLFDFVIACLTLYQLYD